MKKLKEHKDMIKSIGQGSKAVLQLQAYKPAQFEATTTNNKTYKEYKLASRPKIVSEKVEAVRSKALPTHFDTSNKKEFVKHDF